MRDIFLATESWNMNLYHDDKHSTTKVASFISFSNIRIYTAYTHAHKYKSFHYKIFLF